MAVFFTAVFKHLVFWRSGLFSVNPIREAHADVQQIHTPAVDSLLPVQASSSKETWATCFILQIYRFIHQVLLGTDVKSA